MSEHAITTRVTDRDAAQKATRWAGTCTCKNAFVGATYETVEDQWREHVWTLTGSTPKPFGAQADRWQPVAS